MLLRIAELELDFLYLDLVRACLILYSLINRINVQPKKESSSIILLPQTSLIPLILYELPPKAECKRIAHRKQQLTA